MTSRERSLNAAAQRSRQSVSVRLLAARPRKMLHKALGHIVEMQACVQIVPAQHSQRRQVVCPWSLAKWAKLIVAARRRRRDEEEIMRLPTVAVPPCLPIARFFTTTPLRMRRRATTGSCFGSNLTKKMPQGWFTAKGRRRLISSIFVALAGIEPELIGRVVECKVLEVVG